MPKSNTLKGKEEFIPSAKNSVREKSVWTERRLQKLQAELFKVFKSCDSNCQGLNRKGNICDCAHKDCDKIVEQMEKYLMPYGTSIFKRAFKRRATCEEMDRVVSESVNSLLMDIWFKKKVIHTSFGSMLKWKMVYYLDGNINLFDSEKYRSLDAMVDKLETANQEDNAESLIEYYSTTFQDAFFSGDTYSDFYKKDTIKSIIDLAKSSIDTYNKYVNKKARYAIYIRSIYALNRFLCNKDIELMFKNNNKARFYYVKLLDTVRSYLKKYTTLN